MFQSDGCIVLAVTFSVNLVAQIKSLPTIHNSLQCKKSLYFQIVKYFKNAALKICSLVRAEFPYSEKL